MFEQLFSGIKSGMSSAGYGLSSLFSNLFNGQQQPQPVMSGIPQPTISAQTLSATPQNGKFLTLLNDLATQYSQNSRAQDLYNVLPADQAAQVINNQRLVSMKEDEVARENLQRQAISDALKNPSDTSALARLEQIAAITGDPAAIEKYLVASGKGGSAPALLQIVDDYMASLPPEMQTPEERRRQLIAFGKVYDKGIFPDTPVGYQPPVGGTPGIARPITPQMPQVVATSTDSPLSSLTPQLLEPPLLDGYERPAQPQVPAVQPSAPPQQTVPAPQAQAGGFNLDNSYADAISSLEARKAAAKRQAEASVDLATKPDIARATELATNEGKSKAELNANMAKKARDARNVIGLADEADKILKDATSGKIGQAISASAKSLGVSTEATRADARLKVISAALTSNVPRFEGPQGVLDVELYRQAAGDVANSDLPWQDRKAALQTIRDLQSKYLPENQGSASGSPRGGKTGNPVIDKYLE